MSEQLTSHDDQEKLTYETWITRATFELTSDNYYIKERMCDYGNIRSVIYYCLIFL